MSIQHSSRLRTAIQVATARARVVKRQVAAAEWSQRLDAAAYRCEKTLDAHGHTVWFAHGPAGQRFEFSKGAAEGEVICFSHTGGLYMLTVDDRGEMVCDCPCHGSDKHLVAWEAVKMAHRMDRHAIRTQLAAEGAEMMDEAA